jgi:thiol-disulfide isomerase/thioredoxin
MNMLFPESKNSRRGFVFRLLAGAAALAAWPRVRGALTRVGESFPNLSGYGLDGAMPDIKGKVVLVDFWASWCSPCKKSFPVMKEVQDRFASRGFTIVAVSMDEKKEDMDTFLKKNPIPFSVLRDPKGRLAEAAGVEKMPTSFLLGPDGKVAAVHSGFEGEATRKAYLSEVEAALKAAGK